MAVPGFIFDVDGVVLDSIGSYRRAWSAWAKEYRAGEDAIWAVAHGRRPTDIIRWVGSTLDETAALARFDSLIQIEYENVRAYDGAHGMLRMLPQASWTVATSGAQALVVAAFRRLGLPTPHSGVYGEDVSLGKPDPSCFLLAAERLQVSPADCVVVEDAPSGIAAGKAAGMTVIAVTTTHTAQDLRAADSIHNPLAEATALIRSLLTGEPERRPRGSTAT